MCCITKIICVCVCPYSVTPRISGTPWPMITKFCVCNLLNIWKISTEKKIRDFLIFWKFFLNFCLCSKNFGIQIFFLSEIFFRKGRHRPKRGRSVAPLASHQQPRPASVRVFTKMQNFPKKYDSNATQNRFQVHDRDIH